MKENITKEDERFALCFNSKLGQTKIRETTMGIWAECFIEIMARKPEWIEKNCLSLEQNKNEHLFSLENKRLVSKHI